MGANDILRAEGFEGLLKQLAESDLRRATPLHKSVMAFGGMPKTGRPRSEAGDFAPPKGICDCDLRQLVGKLSRDRLPNGILGTRP